MSSAPSGCRHSLCALSTAAAATGALCQLTVQLPLELRCKLLSFYLARDRDDIEREEKDDNVGSTQDKLERDEQKGFSMRLSRSFDDKKFSLFLSLCVCVSL